MRWLQSFRAACVECHGTIDLFRYCSTGYVCRSCAVTFSYHTAMVSVQQWLGLR